MRITRCIPIVLLVLASLQEDAHAAGFALDTQSPRTIGMAAAVTAMIDDPSAIFFNPAGIAQGRFFDAQASGTLILPSTTFHDPTGTETRTPFRVAPTAQAFAAGGVTQNFSIGVGFFTPYGLTIGWPSGWEGRSLITYASLSTYELNPTLAWHIGPVRIGGGVQIEPAVVDLERDIALPNGAFGTSQLGATAWGVGGNGGIQVEAIPKVLSFGLAYRSAVVLDFNGDAHFTGIPDSLSGTIHDQPATSRIVLPDSLAFGVAVRPTPKLVIDLDGVYYGWGYFRSIDVNFPNDASGTLATSQPKRWFGTANVHLGAELGIGPSWNVRAGFMVDPTPAPNDTLTPDLPDATRLVFTAGAGWKHRSGIRLDVGYEFVYLLSRTSTSPLLPGEYNGYANVLSVGVGWSTAPQPH